MKTVTEPPKEIPIAEEADVIVVGGGLAGVAAAVAAARNESHTLLIERSGLLGGVATSGLMASISNYFFAPDGEMVVKGLPQEIVERLAKYGGTTSNWKSASLPHITNDPEVLGLVLVELVEEAGVEVLLHTFVVDSVVEDSQLKGLIVENKAGRQGVLGKIVVDATGDADVAAKSGAPLKYNPPGSNSLEFRMGNVNIQRLYEYFEKNRERWVEFRDMPVPFDVFERNWLEKGIFHTPHVGGCVPGSPIAQKVEEAVKKGDYVKERGLTKLLDAFGLYGLSWNKTMIINTGFFLNIDELNVKEASKAEMEARKNAHYAARFLKKYMPGFEDAFIVTTAPELGVRYTRWIEGEYTLTREERDSKAKFDDVVAVGAVWEAREGSLFRGEFEIPYRCLVPKKVERLLVASGKSVSTEPRGLLRGQVKCMELSEAAGTAAALAAKTGLTPRKLNVKELQATLLKQGVYLGDEERLKELGLIT